MSFAPEQSDWEAIWMGVEDTATKDGWYPAEWDVSFNELSIFEKKVTLGKIDKDSDDIVSSWIISDLSGGGQVDMLTGADQTRCRHLIADARKASAITLPQYVQTLTPSGSGTTYPAYQVGDVPMVIRGTSVYAWDETTDTFGNTDTVTTAPTGKGTRFNAAVFFPLGTGGYARLTDAGSATPDWDEFSGVSTNSATTQVDADAAVESPNVVDFEVWDNKIWALTPTGIVVYSFTGADDEWRWDLGFSGRFGRYNTIETGQTPRKLATFVDNNGDSCLVIVTDSTVYRVDSTTKTYEKTSIQFAPHPDFGNGVGVWRAGEDLKISAGLGMVSYAAQGTIDPDAGLDRGDGLPYTNLGKIVDLVPEASALYAFVSGANSSSVSYTYAAQLASSPAPGTGDGDFSDIRGIAEDSTNDVWIADQKNERVQRASSALAYEAQGGSSGTGTGEFASDNGPYDVACDSSDAVWIVDRGNHRVQKRTTGGTFSVPIDGSVSTTAFALQNTYGPTLNSIDLEDPGDLAKDSSGNIYIADPFNHRIVKINSSGTYVSTLTPVGSSPTPTGVCIDGSDNIYVACSGTSNLQKFNSSFTHQWTSGTIAHIRRVATDDTHVYAAATTSSNLIYKRLCSDGSAVTSWGGTGSGNGQFSSPSGILYHGSEVYVVDAGNARVQVFTTSGTYQRQWVIGSNGRGLDVDASGNVLVCSQTDDTVTRFSSLGVQIDSFSMNAPGGIVIATGDVAWITDIAADTVTKWDEVTITEAGTAAGKLSSPESLDIKRSSGRVYVSDTGNKRLNYYTSAGVYEGTWGSAGSGNGQFGTLGPTQIALNQTSGDVYVLDPSNFRVQQFDSTGTFVRAFGASGVGTGQFTLPAAIAVHPTNSEVFVGDSSRDDVQVFSASGVYLRTFGSTGTGNGQFQGISGICFNRAGTVVFASDLTIERIQSFTISSTTSEFLAVPSVHYWTGFGWMGAWELADSSQSLTWANITVTSHAVDGYRLWWGCTDGNVYSMPLRRTFHNPRAGWQAGYDKFAASGYILSSRFDALMQGFDKKASRLVVFTDNATVDETITVEYRVDIEDDNWIDLGVITAPGKNILAFDVDGDGFSWGQKFNWIQFRFTLARGASNTFQTPILTAAVLNYTKIPQQARSFRFTVGYPKESWNERTGVEIRNGLAALLRAEQYVKLVHQDTVYRGQLAAVNGVTSLGKNFYGGAAVNFIEIKTDS